MSRLAELRDALADTVEEAAPALARVRTGAANLPGFVINPASPFASYQERMGGETSGRYRFEIAFLFSSLAEEASVEQLLELVSPDGPVIPALFALDLDDAEVMSIAGQAFGQFRVGDAHYSGASLLVELDA